MPVEHMTEEAFKHFVIEELKNWINGLITDQELVNRLIAGTPAKWLTD